MKLIKWDCLLFLATFMFLGIGTVDEAAFASKTEAEVNPAPLENNCLNVSAKTSKSFLFENNTETLVEIKVGGYDASRDMNYFIDKLLEPKKLESFPCTDETELTEGNTIQCISANFEDGMYTLVVGPEFDGKTVSYTDIKDKGEKMSEMLAKMASSFIG